MFQLWNIFVPLMECFCSTYGTSVYVLLSAWRLDIVLFKSHELWFYTLRHFGENLTDIFLVFRRNHLITTAHAPHQRMPKMPFQRLVNSLLSIACERTITPAHSTGKPSQLPPMKLRTVVIASRLSMSCGFVTPRKTISFSISRCALCQSVHSSRRGQRGA